MATKAFTPFYATVIDGKKVEVVHLVRRRYGVLIDGKEAGYLTSKDPLSVVSRVESIDKLADLKERLH